MVETLLIQVEHRRMRNMLRAIIPELTMVGFVTMLGQLSLRLLLLLQRLAGRINEALDMWIFMSHIVCHICCDKQLANVKFFATDIIGIKSD